MTTATVFTPEPPLRAAARSVVETLAQVAGCDPTFLAVEDKEGLLSDLVQAARQIEGLLVDTLAVAGDVAEKHAAPTPAAWLASVSNEPSWFTGRLQRLADDVARHPELAPVLRDGSVTARQAEVIVAAVDALGGEVTPLVREKSLDYLIEHTARLTPKELKRLGDGILAYVAPDLADEQERRKLEDEQDRARAAASLTMRSHGDGSTSIYIRTSDAKAARLKTYLSAFSSPRHDAATGGTVEDSRYLDPVTGKRLKSQRVLGEAFGAFLEAVDPDRMPSHGGAATSVVVTIDLEQLATGVGFGTLVGPEGGEKVTAGEVRRLACQAGIIPAVLGGKSEVLDLGRSKRLFSPAQRKALMIKFPTCAVDGCNVRAEQCEAHHVNPWATGGVTDLDNGMLVCPFHHHLVDDPRYEAGPLPGGGLKIRLRT